MCKLLKIPRSLVYYHLKNIGDYVNWYNNHRLHGSLDYLTLMEYRGKNKARNVGV